MSEYLGTIGERITIDVTLVNEYQYSTLYGFRNIEHSIYTMKDADGNVLVWKTTSVLSAPISKPNGEFAYFVNKGDKIRITGTVKAHSEYKGQKQTELQRVKAELIERALTKDELDAIKRAEQLDSLEHGDFIWRMPYRQYKTFYADCETVAGSYLAKEREPATIEVIIRNGRLKASGVRGKHYRGYCLKNENGENVTYRAVSAVNAIKRADKEFAGHTWTVDNIFEYMKR